MRFFRSIEERLRIEPGGSGQFYETSLADGHFGDDCPGLQIRTGQQGISVTYLDSLSAKNLQLKELMALNCAGLLELRWLRTTVIRGKGMN